MDYEKKYKELVARIKNAYHDENINDERFCCVINEICPELKGSEDEKIRKDIVKYLNNELNNVKQLTPRTNEFEMWIAWLEKQGEQRPKELTNSEFAKKCKDLSELEQYILSLVPTRLIDSIKVDARNIRYLVEKEQEQKPVTHKYNVGATIYYNSFGEVKSMVVANVIDNGDGNPMYEDADGGAVFEKNLVEQKPVEWSEEDETGLRDALWAIEQARTIAKDENDMGNLWYAENWLKSLRPQRQWKPSEFEIASLGMIIDHPDRMTDYNKKNLQSLYEQLKAL